MSIFPRHIQTDLGYKVDVLFSCKCLLDILNGIEDSVGINSANYLWRVFDEMENNFPFTPAWDSREPRQFLRKGEEFRYRAPVWKIFLEVTNRINGFNDFQENPSFVDSKTCAAFLKEQIRLYDKHTKLQAWSEKAKEEIEKLGLTISFSGLDHKIRTPADVDVDFKPKKTGRLAIIFFKYFLQETIVELEKN